MKDGKLVMKTFKLQDPFMKRATTYLNLKKFEDIVIKIDENLAKILVDNRNKLAQPVKIIKID